MAPEANVGLHTQLFDVLGGGKISAQAAFHILRRGITSLSITEKRTKRFRDSTLRSFSLEEV